MTVRKDSLRYNFTDRNILSLTGKARLLDNKL